MPIQGYNFAPAMFLLELSTQCAFAIECERRLREAAPTWFTDATPAEFHKRRAPRDVMIDCAGFLSAAGVVSKLLFSGQRTKSSIKYRCQRLRQLLDFREDDLPLLRSLAIRNSFEHVDERLDKILRHFTAGSFAPISVSEAAVGKDTIVLKRFDPKKLTISFLQDGVSLTDYGGEIATVEARINPSFAKLTGSEYRLWP